MEHLKGYILWSKEERAKEIIIEGLKLLVHDSSNITTVKAHSGLDYPLNVNLKKPAWLQYLIICMSVVNLSIVAFTIVF